MKVKEKKIKSKIDATKKLIEDGELGKHNTISNKNIYLIITNNSKKHL
jgi:hypothetical protein